MQRITSYSDCPQLAEYPGLIRSGEIEACAEQHRLIEYVEERFREENLSFSQEQVDKYLSYQKYFPFDLYPWEVYVFILHNCIFREDGLPRWRDLFAYLGRGAGKNGYLSFEDFCLVTETNGIRNYHIDICATTEDQAKTSFDEIHSVLENPRFTKAMRHNFEWNSTVIRNRKTNSEIKYRTNNAKSKDGLRSGKVDFDEIHAYSNWDNLNVFTTGLGKKPHPRITYITTDGDVRDAPLDSLKERSFAILDGKEADNGLLPFICRLDSDEEVDDETKWEKANPSLRYKPELMEEIRTQYVNYKRDPQKNASFMTKRMNRPKTRMDIQVTSWENILKTNRPLPDLEGKTCVCGIDYTKTTDFMSACLLFRLKDDMYYVKHHSWFCTHSYDRELIKIPLDEMVGRGLLTMVDDVEVSPNLVTGWLAENMTRYNVTKVAMDSYRLSILKRALEEIGFVSTDRDSMKIVRPSDIMFVQGKIDSLFSRGHIIWGDDPLMRWFTNNTKLTPAPNNNYKYDKIERRSRKNDGFMAFVHAMTAEDAIPEEYSLEFMPPIVF